jgi:ATP-dependent helicase/nuclease subunit A
LREQWSQHVGPLPAQRVLCATTFLDWIGPAGAMMGDAKDRVEMTHHAEEEMAGWAAMPRGGQLSDAQLRLARLEPLEPAPQMHSSAQQVKDRLTRKYRFEAFTKVPAAQSVGSLTKMERWNSDGGSPMQASLTAPRCVQNEIVLAPAEIGSATHLVLEHLDFSRTCDREDLQKQVAEILRKKLLTPALAETVDLDSIAWLISTPLGKLLRENHHSLRREVAIYFPLAAKALISHDPSDRIMVRGRVDVLISDKNGIVIADYKTDRVTSDGVSERAKFYEPQLASYRDAIAKITGKAVRSANLVFLSAKVICEL